MLSLSRLVRLQALFAAWAIAVTINLFGTGLNVIAVLGLFRKKPTRVKGDV